jgi:ribosomal protein L7/L12
MPKLTITEYECKVIAAQKHGVKVSDVTILRQDNLQQEVNTYLQQNRKLDAVKIVRNVLNCSLLEAKRYVDALED